MGIELALSIALEATAGPHESGLGRRKRKGPRDSPGGIASVGAPQAFANAKILDQVRKTMFVGSNVK